jgi:NodT family efflux transporter outer membrane factor (OMF) lipoprotein
MRTFSLTLTNRAVIGLFISAALTACAVGPDYYAPNMRLVPLGDDSSALRPANHAALPLDKWWLGFNDPVLNVIVERALQENLDLAIAIARVTQARAMASGADAQLLPSGELNASALASRQSLRGSTGAMAGSSPGFKRNVHDLSVGSTASWELDLFGGLRRNAAAAGNVAQASEADHAGVRVIVAADAADTYFQIRGYQARIAIAEKQIETDEQLLKLVQRRYSAGAAQGLEVAQADALVKSARATVPQLRIALKIQLNRLSVLMGTQPGMYPDALRELRPIASVPSVPTSAEPVQILRRRPDVIAAERRLAASSERIGVAISEYYPKLSIAGILGFNSLSGGNLFASSAFQAAGGGTLRWRLFDFGKVDAEVARAKGSNAEALALYRRSVLQAAEDVENAFVSLAQTQIHSLQIDDQVKALSKARDLSERAYRAGTITLTDVLLADQQLLSARDQLDASRASTARAAVAVYRALGGGWDAFATPAVNTKLAVR